MQHVQPVSVLCAAIISTALVLAAPGMARESSFVFVPRADSPGNDYLRVDNSSFEDCGRRCDAESECNAFTYNQRKGVCFLKHSANPVTTFYAFAVTGIKLAPSGPATPYFITIPRADSPWKRLRQNNSFHF